MGTIVGANEIMTSSKCAAFFDLNYMGSAYLGMSSDPSEFNVDDCNMAMVIDSVFLNTQPVDTSESIGGVAIFKVWAPAIVGGQMKQVNIIEAYMNKGMPHCIAAACIPSEQIPHGSRCWIPKGKCLI